MLSSEDIKKTVGTLAAREVQENMTVGLGTGTTAHWLIVALGERVQQGLQCRAVPTSRQTALLAEANNIPLVPLNEVERIDLTIDGADEIDPQLQLIKGGGGALLQEKMVASASQQVLIIADHTKLVPRLGLFPLPVELVPYNWKQVQRIIEKKYSINTNLRGGQQPFVTDHGHYILDCHFKQIPDAEVLAQALRNITGVVEVGLFLHFNAQAMIGYPDGSIKMIGPE